VSWQAATRMAAHTPAIASSMLSGMFTLQGSMRLTGQQREVATGGGYLCEPKLQARGLLRHAGTIGQKQTYLTVAMALQQ
jgi:hypothetical protein